MSARSRTGSVLDESGCLYGLPRMPVRGLEPPLLYLPAVIFVRKGMPWEIMGGNKNLRRHGPDFGFELLLKQHLVGH
jgi:hypothetical protein